MEPNKARKKIISYFIFIGGAFSAYIFYCLFTYEVSVYIEARHIRYDLHFPNLGLRRSLIFLIPVVPIFLSSLRLMKLLGGALLGSLILSLLFFFLLCYINVEFLCSDFECGGSFCNYLQQRTQYEVYLDFKKECLRDSQSNELT